MYLVRFNLIQLTQIHKYSTIRRRTREKQKQGEDDNHKLNWTSFCLSLSLYGVTPEVGPSPPHFWGF
jgi:hypothetical protein